MKSRRNFIKNSSSILALLGLSSCGNHRTLMQDYDEINDYLTRPRKSSKPSVIGLESPALEKVRIGMIGCGSRGLGLLYQFNALCPEKAKIVALCDVQEKMVTRSLNYLENNGSEKPDIYTGSLDVWQEMVRRDDLDLIIIATPWEDHVPMSVYAMQCGKHVGVEVPAAYTVEGCWQLVETAEETQKNCIMMENVCYGDEELWLLNMAHSGVLGTLGYAEAAYIHDLRKGLFNNSAYQNWRVKHHLDRDGNLYPTHGLGPVALYMNIMRGDNFDYLVSMSSPPHAITEFAESLDKDNPFYNRKDFIHGDINNSLIKTNNGNSILVQHDVVTPRPYDRKNVLSGTKGYHQGFPSKLSLDGYGHHFLDEENYNIFQNKYRHSLWTELDELINKNKGGHGGMDFVMAFRIIDLFNKGLPQDMDVYDGAAWSVIGPLSKISIELGGMPVRFPDFTSGKWKNERNQPLIEKR